MTAWYGDFGSQEMRNQSIITTWKCANDAQYDTSTNIEVSAETTTFVKLLILRPWPNVHFT